MGYDIAIPAAIAILLLAAVFATLFLRRRASRKRLDFRKGTTYEEPQDEGATTAVPRTPPEPPNTLPGRR